jgi:hypothetical protein
VNYVNKHTRYATAMNILWTPLFYKIITFKTSNMETGARKETVAFKIFGDWKRQADKLKEKFPQLTDSDLKFESGRETDLLKRIELRLHKKREEVMNIIKKGQPTTL